jgi:hypothetical protein
VDHIIQQDTDRQLSEDAVENRQDIPFPNLKSIHHSLKPLLNVKRSAQRFTLPNLRSLIRLFEKSVESNYRLERVRLRIFLERGIICRSTVLL